MSWSDALRLALDEYREATYAWGEHDCIQFVSFYVLARTGIDYASRFSYQSEQLALRLMAMHDGIEGLIESCLGPSKPVAGIGDVVVCHAESWHIPGISNGHFVWAFDKERGLCRIPMPAIICAWEV